ncbi:hypothetical protein [Pedobacter mendelii]|uniref:Glycosyl transferase n=1 Tax=Pedobacter mendelii TaxID=1908240 RepID=A0ABQ2BNN3_9SPHI|nr:hypothetical protein [Pedobacter mendelii]GGI28811.1 hypothetical protein GCM10008119_34510 [Pedobacter mendelii]
MSSKKTNVAILVHACDRYEFLFQGFDYFFSAHWDFKIPGNYYFATEALDVKINGFENIKSGSGAWADRLAFLLKNKIEEDYILYFQEDMWLSKPVNRKFFTELFDQAIKNDWKHVKLHSSDVYKTKPIDNYIEGFNVSEVDNRKSDFLMSHQVTLWRKDYLLAQLYKNEHPWRNERRATKRLKKLNPQIFHIDYFSENGSAEINVNNQPVKRSEYHAVSFNSTLNFNVLDYVKLLNKGKAEHKKYATELQDHYDNNLTHDGKPKAKKEDIFKKFKNWFTKKKG